MGMKHRQRKNNSRKKRKHRDEYNLVDRLSELPDDVLVSVLSLLSLKEATSTSILSKRWQYVWPSTMALDFDAKFFDDEVYQNFIQLQPALREQESLRYVNWVNHVVEQHRGPSIERFRVCFDIDSSIDKDLHLFDCFTRNRAYSFPHKLLCLEKESAFKLKHLDYEIPSLHSSQYNIGFEFLKVLHFQFVDVTGEVLEHILYNCPVLERLTVSFATKSLVKLGVVGPSIALKYLAIKWCTLESIEIRDAKLVSFIYEGDATNLLLSNVPFLVEVTISEGIACNFLEESYFPCRSIELPFTQLSCCLSQLEIFMLDIDLAVYNWDYVFPVLANVKHLELTVKANYDMNLFHLTSFMKASPLLQRLVLKVLLISW
ncbi:hypothetical protein PRUPE_1G269300 [Prunus persica]|uniref:F-box domain-containing protein n=1 Tax=Prunus persica TaxID=3760 RepID=A0A251R3T2_PRUPE|nr:hypothetical protein PRUPE_1G269300 [Prunus persica]